MSSGLTDINSQARDGQLVEYVKKGTSKVGDSNVYLESSGVDDNSIIVAILGEGKGIAMAHISSPLDQVQKATLLQSLEKLRQQNIVPKEARLYARSPASETNSIGKPIYKTVKDWQRRDFVYTNLKGFLSSEATFKTKFWDLGKAHNVTVSSDGITPDS